MGSACHVDLSLQIQHEHTPAQMIYRRLELCDLSLSSSTGGIRHRRTTLYGLAGMSHYAVWVGLEAITKLDVSISKIACTSTVGKHA